jgi:hypothetical protein
VTEGFCCKSPFALIIKISFGCTHDFRAKMWGTSSPDDKLADDLGNAIEGTRISGRRWIFLTAEKLTPDNLGLLQQYLRQSGRSASELLTAVKLSTNSLNAAQTDHKGARVQGCQVGRKEWANQRNANSASRGSPVTP